LRTIEGSFVAEISLSSLKVRMLFICNRLS
jgi:hypothetical protein